MKRTYTEMLVCVNFVYDLRREKKIQVARFQLLDKSLI